MSERYRRRLDIWPGFVDALAALLLVVIFVLLIFTLGQFVLTDVVSGQESALARLNQRIERLGELLSMERDETQRLQRRVAELRATLGDTRSERDRLAGELQRTRDQLGEAERAAARRQQRLIELQADIEDLRALKAELTARVAELARTLDDNRAELARRERMTDEQRAQIERLNRQIDELHRQLAQVAEALEASEAQVEAKQARIEELGQRLNEALARKAKELQRYRSEFFGRLRERLADHADIRIEGDRFVIQSSLLFDTASAELGAEGKTQLRRLTATIRAVIGELPGDIPWVLRIDGHTDRRPIDTERFPSNWELATARAVSVVKYMIDRGIPPQRLAATGFAEHHPVAAGATKADFAQNRRIEIKLTRR